MNGVLLSDDLMFSSRITGEAKAQGFAIKTVRNISAMLEMIPSTAAGGVFVDLTMVGDVINELARQVHAMPGRPNVVAYGSHVDGPSLHRARDAGCDVVLPRSAFCERLPADLAHWLKAA